MTEKYYLNAQKRDLAIKPKKYQNDGFILGNIFGVGKSQPIILPKKEIIKLLTQIGESTVIYLTVEGKKELPVMISEIQRKPVNGQVIHLSLRQVDLKEKITAPIIIETIGEFKVPDSLFILVRQEVEAEALPTDLPESFIVDVSKFTAIGEQITFAELEYDRKKIHLVIENENEPVIVVNRIEGEIAETNAEVAAEEVQETAAVETVTT